MANSLDESAAEIAREIALLHKHSYGDPVARPEVSVEDGFVVVVIDIELWKAELTLVAAGHSEQVRRTREAYQDAVRATSTAIIEHATGRRVSSFTSRAVIDEEAGSWSVEVFRLAQ